MLNRTSDSRIPQSVIAADAKRTLSGARVDGKLILAISRPASPPFGPLYLLTTATASTSISHSGRTRRLTTTKVLAGGLAVLTNLSRISRTTGTCEGSTFSEQ